MQFKNFSVAAKIWVLLLSVLVLVLLAGGGLAGYLGHLDTQLRQTAKDYDYRIRLAVQWRGLVDLAAHSAVLSAMSTEQDVVQRAVAKTKESIEGAAVVQKQMEQVLTSEEGKLQLQKIAQARSRVLELNTTISSLREQAQYAQVRSLLDAQFLPAVAQYSQGQIDLIALERDMRNRILAQGEQDKQTSTRVGIAALAAIVLLGLALSVVVMRQITEPLKRAVGVADAIAQGDLTVNVYDDRKDELGHLLRSLSVMTQRLRDLVGQVRGGVDSVSSAAAQIASGNADLSARTEQTAANLEETAASIEELTSTVTQSADTARQANQLASTAVHAAERGGDVVQDVVQSMEQINTSSRKISDIIGVIDGIAFQTNILALNAAVEAARAGEQGRGFAVVAGEVRSLAQRSAEAAKEIKALITDSVRNVDVGTDQVAKAGESMQEIVSSVRRVTDLIGELSAAAGEQHDGFAQVNQAVSNLDQMTQQNAALVEQSSAAALAMNDQAQRLAQVVSIFKLGQEALSAQPIGDVSAPQPPTLAAAKVSTARAVHPVIKAVPANSKKTVASASVKLQSPVASAKAPQKMAGTASDDWESF